MSEQKNDVVIDSMDLLTELENEKEKLGFYKPVYDEFNEFDEPMGTFEIIAPERLLKPLMDKIFS